VDLPQRGGPSVQPGIGKMGTEMPEFKRTLGRSAMKVLIWIAAIAVLSALSGCAEPVTAVDGSVIYPGYVDGGKVIEIVGDGAMLLFDLNRIPH